MSFRYDLTAAELLRLLGDTKPVGRDALLQAERERRWKLPPMLMEFLSLAADSPLFKTVDLWTEKPEELWSSYDSIQEWIDGDRAYWEQDPEAYADNEYFQLSRLPREQWGSRVPEHLLIGSDFGAGVARMGIPMEALGQEDPPVYMLLEGDDLADWQLVDGHLSGFLLRILCDALCCGEYDTAERVLKDRGWTARSLSREDLTELGLDLTALTRQKSMYGRDAVCGCAYDAEDRRIIAARLDEDGDFIMAYQKDRP